MSVPAGMTDGGGERASDAAGPGTIDTPTSPEVAGSASLVAVTVPEAICVDACNTPESSIPPIPGLACQANDALGTSLSYSSEAVALNPMRLPASTVGLPGAILILFPEPGGAGTG